MTDLAKLVVRLEAQTAQYMGALEKAEKRLERFDSEASVTARGIGSAFLTVATAGATAFAAMGKAAIDNADQLSKLSQSTGVTTESLSQLQYAAGQSGLEIDAFAKSTGNLARQQVAAAKGSKESIAAFKAIGVSVKNADGSLKGLEPLMLDVADRFSQIEDGAAKAAIGQELFGKSSAAMIPFLNMGRDGIEAMKEEADRFGLTVTTKAGKAAEAFNDNLGRISAASKGLANRFVQQVLPVMSSIAARFVESAKSGGALDFAVKALSVTFKAFVTAGTIVSSVFQQIGRIVYGVAAAIVRIAQGEFALAAEEFTSAFEDAKENVTQDMETITQVWSDQVPEMEKVAEDLDGALKESIVFNDVKAGEAAAKAVSSALASLRDMESGLMQQVATFGMADAAVMQYRVTLGDLSETLDKAGESGKIYGETIVALQLQLDDLNKQQQRMKEQQEETNRLNEEAMDLVKSLRTPLEIYEDTIARLNVLLEKGAIAQDTYNKAIEKAQDAFDRAKKSENKFLEEANRNVQDILSDGIRTGLKDGFEDGAEGALDAFTDMLERMAAEALAANLAAKLFGDDGLGSGGGWFGKIFGGSSSSNIAPGEWDRMGGGGGGWLDTAIGIFGSIFGGSRDSGGRGRPGTAYRIGVDEEYFVPDRPGMFLTPESVGRGGGVTQNINVTGQVTQRSARQLELEAARRQSIARARLG